MTALPDAADVPLTTIIAGLIVAAILLAGIAADVYLLAKAARHRDKLPTIRERLLAHPWSWHDGLYLILVMGTLFAALVLAAQVLSHCGIILSDTMERLLLLAETITMQVVAIAAAEYLRQRHRRTYAECFAVNRIYTGKALWQGIVFYLALMPPVAVTALAANIILQAFDIPLRSQDILIGFADATTPFWFRTCLVLLAVVIAPFVEELMFRGIALPLAAKLSSPTAAIVSISLLFAAVHGHVSAIAPLFVIAVGFSLAYIFTGTLLVPIIMHAIFNGVNLVIFYLSYNAPQL